MRAIKIWVRVSVERPALPLHRVWDGLLTSSNNARTLGNMATELRSKFPRSSLNELSAMDPETWSKECFEIATKIAYRNGAFRRTPKGQHKNCDDVTDALVVLGNHAASVRQIADWRMLLGGYRLATLFEIILGN